MTIEQIEPLETHGPKITGYRTLRAGSRFADLKRTNIRPSVPEYRRNERAGLDRFRAAGGPAEANSGAS